MIGDDKLIATTCHIADIILRLKYDKSQKEIIHTNDDGSTEFVDFAQDEFDSIYDQVENLIMENVEIYAPYQEERKSC
tara:strand:- start:589 stop:822 length:234 start_codon:yes stop_codon:yes gene_type:complete